MTSPFASRDAKVSAAIGRAFGEGFDIVPMTAQTDVNLPSVADTGRTQQLGVIGTWEGPAKSRLPHNRGSEKDAIAQSFAASAPSVSIADADLAWLPVKGDLCRRLFDAAVYEISTVLSDGFDRTLFKLSSKKRTS